jgi:hypothetical protein
LYQVSTSQNNISAPNSLWRHLPLLTSQTEKRGKFGKSSREKGVLVRKLANFDDFFRSDSISPGPANCRSQVNDKMPPESPDPIFVKTSAESLAHKHTKDMKIK